MSIASYKNQHIQNNYTSRKSNFNLNADELTKIGYKVIKINSTKYNINGVLDIDIKNFKYFDLLKNIEGYMFSRQELNNIQSLNINWFIRNYIKNQ